MLYNAVFVRLPPLLLCLCACASWQHHLNNKDRHRCPNLLARDTRFFCVDLNVIYYVIGHSKAPIPLIRTKQWSQ